MFTRHVTVALMISLGSAQKNNIIINGEIIDNYLVKIATFNNKQAQR